MRIYLPSKNTLRSSQLGFSLAEVAVGVTVMALMFLALYSGITYGFYETQLARENLRATQIILEKMEGVRLYTYAQLTNSTTFPSSFTAQYYPLASANNAQGATFYGTLTVGDAASGADYNTDLRLVTVTVTWTNVYSKSSVVRSRQMQTLVGHYGIQNYTFYN